MQLPAVTHKYNNRKSYWAMAMKYTVANKIDYIHINSG